MSRAAIIFTFIIVPFQFVSRFAHSKAHTRFCGKRGRLKWINRKDRRDHREKASHKLVSMWSLLSLRLHSQLCKILPRKDQSVKPLRAVGEGVGGAERRAGGGDGASQVGPVARAQVGIVLQLICRSNFRAP